MSRGGIYKGPSGETLHGDGSPVGQPASTNTPPENTVKTPRTDAVVEKAYQHEHWYNRAIEIIDFCRQLEQELQQLQAENAKLKSRITQLESLNDEREKTTRILKEDAAKLRNELEDRDRLAEFNEKAYKELQQQLSQSNNLVLKMREALKSIELGRWNIEVQKKVMDALSLTTPLANSYIKREEFEKVVAALKRADRRCSVASDVKQALSHAETLLKPQTTEARKEGE